MDRGAWWVTVHGVAKSQTQSYSRPELLETETQGRLMVSIPQEGEIRGWEQRDGRSAAGAGGDSAAPRNQQKHAAWPVVASTPAIFLPEPLGKFPARPPGLFFVDSSSWYLDKVLVAHCPHPHQLTRHAGWGHLVQHA